MIVTITIDTEEDDWGSYVMHGASTENILHLNELQELFERFGARPTYLINRPPLVQDESLRILKELAAREDVEIGGHCHPWNTPPATGEGEDRSMMFALPLKANRGKIKEVTRLIESELEVRPRSFRAGRWGFGPTVSEALVAEGYEIDCSVSPLIDWSPIGGPDYGEAPLVPYRCRASKPLAPDQSGDLIELPTTVGFLHGDPAVRGRWRRQLENSRLTKLKLVGIADRTGLATRRWLSPENSTGAEMRRLVEACRESGFSYASMTFHSCTLLPGATPFVRNGAERMEFVGRIESFLAYCRDQGFSMRTLSEAAVDLGLTGSPENEIASA